ncbi:MAG: tRNA-dihydrouridine synthase family protein [Lachnospiraceae bacterium]|nr:tRNA-dihydrouridine synthase family protein [Lachnospiraceae bacterium]
MILQLAPLEGITTYIYRNAYAQHFGQIDRYYTPFLSLHKEKEFNHKERQEILPENNKGLLVIPQVLTNSSEDFLQAACKLKELGYDEVNINMGCPSGTVTAKAKGAGMLEDPMLLDKFLYKIFEKTPVKISIKTRLGMDKVEEWEDLLKIYNKYTLTELIVHARVRADFYQNAPNWKAFALAMECSENPLCYNGDIFTMANYQKLTEVFPKLQSVMLGRGLLANPFLAGQICDWEYNQQNNQQYASQKHHLNREMNGESGNDVESEKSGGWEVERFRAFHDEIYAGYQEIMSGDRNVLFKMKELWTYMIFLWPDASKHAKKLRKLNSCSEYEIYVNNMFRTVDRLQLRVKEEHNEPI